MDDAEKKSQLVEEVTVGSVTIPIFYSPNRIKIPGEPIFTQPKGNEKKFVITHIKIGGETHKAPDGYFYIKPEVHGKKGRMTQRKTCRV